MPYSWWDLLSYGGVWLVPPLLVLSYALLGLGLIQNLIYVLQIPLAAVELLRTKRREKDDHTWWLVRSDITLPISVVIPAYNEEVTISNTLVATLATQYPSFEVIVVNDGSKDRTLQVMIDTFSLKKAERYFEKRLPHKTPRGIYRSSIYPNLIVADKENGGRSDALNLGIDLARYPIFCTLDADSLIDPSALLKAVTPFVEKPETMAATGGTIRVSNGCMVENGQVVDVRLPRKLLPLLQVVEYMRAFLMGRLAWSSVGILTVISGAFSVFRRDLAIQAGGFDPSTIGEDFELVLKIHKYCLKNRIPYEMEFVPEPVCWTEVPESMEVLRSQRIRWHQGGLEVFFRHREMFMNPRFGRIGTVAYPIMLIFDVLGPLAELIGYIMVPLCYALGILSTEFVLAYVCMFFVFGVFVSTMSLVLEEISLRRFRHARDLLLLAVIAIVENFGYRQYNNVWRLIGWWRFLRKKQQWGNMRRLGASKSPA